MPTKPVDSRKLKTPGAAGPSGSKGKRTEKKKTPVTQVPPPAGVPSFGIQDAQRARTKRSKKKALRRVLSLSIVSYLGYNFFYACGAPFDQASDKPAICQGIDPIKLDLYELYQSDYVQSNIYPYVAPITSTVCGLYHDYGVPAQVKVVSLYDQHGKPLVNKGYQQASHVYAQHVEPKVSPLVAKSKIHIDQAKIHANQVKTQLQPYYQQASKQATQAQLFAKQQYENLPPPVKQRTDQAINKVIEYYQRAEKTDMLPILTEAYWRIIDFYQYQFIPFIKTHPTTAHVQNFYDQHIRSFVDTNIMPLLLLVKDRTTHVNQLFNHALTLLPQRPLSDAPSKSTVASSIVETKTPIIDATKVVSDIPLTTPAAAAATTTATPATTKTIKSKAQQVSSSAEPASSAVPAEEEAVSTPVKQATIASLSKAKTATGSIKTEATIAKDAVDKDQDSVKPVSVRPTSTPEYVEMEVESPQADKKEAVYCPTCNAADEQVIVAPTEKHVVPVRDEKEVFEIHTDKDVFEVNKEPVIVPPQTPAHLEDEEVNVAAPIKQDNHKVKDQTAPIKKEQDKKKEEDEEEEQLFSTQVEHDVDEDGFPEPAVPLKEDNGEKEEEEENEEVKETPIVTAVVDKQKVEIPLPVATEKDQDKIAVPNDESEYEESKEQIVIQAPAAAHQEEPVVKKEAIDVEPILKEPIVPNDESRFEAKSEYSNQDADPPVRYHRVEKALSQCPSY